MVTTAKRTRLRAAVAEAYRRLEGRVVSNADLYKQVASIVDLDPSELTERVPVGPKGAKCNLTTREIRWAQQSLKMEGLVESIGRDQWQMTARGREQLTPAGPNRVMLAWSCKLGIALWGDTRAVAESIREPIHLWLSSPPYALSRPRTYGQVPPHLYVDWLCQQLEPVISRLAVGGSLAINVGQDLFRQGEPARHSLNERLIIALEDRFGLARMDTLIWHNPSKAPGPVQWASKTRQQLNVGYESVLWLSNDPRRCFADNRRVLYTPGPAVNPHAASPAQTGSIPTNVLRLPTPCAEQRKLRVIAETIGLPPHSATYPLTLPRFLIRYLTRPGDLVADTFAGSCQTLLAAVQENRRAIVGDLHAEYLGLGATRQAMHEEVSITQPFWQQLQASIGRLAAKANLCLHEGLHSRQAVRTPAPAGA